MEELGIIVILAVIILALCIYFIKFSGINLGSAIDIFKSNIYLDNNGTTKICPEALNAYENSIGYGNASSSYASAARELINESDRQIKNWVQSPNYNVIYTSGGSESNDTIVKSLVDYACFTDKKLLPHVISSSYEHSSLLDCLKTLEKENRIRLTLINPSIYGFINPQDVFNAVSPETILVSIMHANNEIGTLNDIQKICQFVKIKNPDTCFHSDIVQSFGKYSIPLEDWKIDAASVSCHKFYGPQGVGYLIVNNPVFSKIQKYPLVHGSQNHGSRGGTTNITGINSARAALFKTINNRQEKNDKLLEMKKYIVDYLISNFPIGNYQSYAGRPDNFVKFSPLDGVSKNEIIFLGDSPLLNDMTPNTLLFSIVKYGPIEKHFCNVKLKKDLQDRGVIISIGSACHSEAPSPSHVLHSIRAPYSIRCGVIRVSLGDYNTQHDVRKFCKILSDCIELQNK